MSERETRQENGSINGLVLLVMCYERQNVPQCHYSLFDILFLEQKTITNESKRNKKEVSL